MRESRLFSQRSRQLAPSGVLVAHIQVNTGWPTQKVTHWKVIRSSVTWLKAGDLGLEKVPSKRIFRGLGGRGLRRVYGRNCLISIQPSKEMTSNHFYHLGSLAQELKSQERASDRLSSGHMDPYGEGLKGGKQKDKVPLLSW